MAGMAGRIDNVRNELKASLDSKYPEKDWSHITNQIGMFSFTGLSPAQVDNMTNKHQVYMTRDGRISLAGLISAKVGQNSNLNCYRGFLQTLGCSLSANSKSSRAISMEALIFVSISPPW